jgi:RNA polymerase sigma factor (sigma-70 family)
MRNDQDAQDVVQESCMKALRAFDSFRGGDFRAWFLTIVRNTSFTWLRRNKDSQGRRPNRAGGWRGDCRRL